MTTWLSSQHCVLAIRTSAITSSSTSSLLTAMAPRRNEQWPTTRDLPHTQSLVGAVRRRCVLGGIYFFWVCGLVIFGFMWVYTFVSAVKMVTNAEPIPASVRVHVALMALYESYRWLAPPLPWMRARHFVRKSFSFYPYFRFNTCIFEDDVQQQPTNDASKEKSDGGTTLKYNFTPALPAQDKSLYAFHPHGILTCGMAVNGAHHLRFAETDARWLVAENLFWFPVLRDLLRWLEFDAVGKDTFVKLMQSGQNIGFVPGGFEEATLYARGKHRVYLKKRFGFIKLALQHGYKVYPAYTFGEELTYTSFPYFLTLRLKLNEFKVPGAAFFGSLWCFFMPRSDVDLITVVGTPLQLPTIAQPTKDDVSKYHALYVTKLQTLFNRHKGAYATDPDAELELY